MGLGNVVGGEYRKLIGPCIFAGPALLVAADDCAPLLARYDRIVEYDVQRSCYEGFSVAVLEKGHITSVLAADVLRRHLLDVVPASEGPE